MISQIFFLSSRGDILVNRDYRGDLFKETPEIFYRNAKTLDTSIPVFCYEGVNYIYLEKNSVYIVTTTRFNV